MEDVGSLMDSVSVCLSKGLGAPVGSVLAGPHTFIHQARRIRKRFGGGMRQAGFLAAAGRFALNNHVDRLAEDHERAKELAKALEATSWVKHVVPVETNIVIFHPDAPVDNVVDALRNEGILAVPFGRDAIRLVVHLGINTEMISEFTFKIIKLL
jgi:threonine aldolase